jgi:alpha-galactosidase
MYQEVNNWEVYQYVSREKDLAVVYFYRCLSPESECTVRLRGLEPEATYRIGSYSGRPEQDHTGAELMDRGFTCRLPNTRNADILVLRCARG